ncbi:MAG TPA: ATP-binding protein [Candidatus Saccharimonadales bacterium]|nr:ATP-binding protein [Candidatus Saccharimonadales bacterium]
MSLIKKVFIAISAVAIFMAIAMLYFGITFMRSAVGEASANQQVQLAQETMRSIDRTLYDHYQQIRLVGQDDVLSEAVKNKGNVALRSAVSERLKEFSRNNEGWATLEAVGAEGVAIGTSESGEVNAEYELDDTVRRAVFEKALQGTVGHSDVFSGKVTGKPAMLFAAPIRDDSVADSPVVGVVLGRLSWSAVLTILQNDINKTITLFNSKGIELGDSKPEHAEEILKEGATNNPAMAAALQGKEGSIITRSTDNDHQALLSYVQQHGLREFGGNKWVLVIETPTAEVFATTNGFARTLPWIFAGVTTIAITAVMLILNRIVVRHIRLLTYLTEKIAAGDLTQRARIMAHDELGRLGQAYNRMAEKLQELYRGLETKVAQKTAQLAQRVKDSETARARDEAILAGMGEGLIALDEKGRVMLINVRAADLAGAPRDMFFERPLAQTWKELHDASDKPLPDEKRPEVIAITTRQQITETYTCRNKEGKRIAIGINATPILNQNQIVGVVIIVRDITKEKEVDRMKTEFISLASHQLRTPLSAIRWFGEMLLSGDAGKLNPEQEEFAKNVYDSTERMIELVNSLLNISRMESGRIIVAPKPTDLNELVSGIVNDLKAKTEQKQQTLIVSVHKEMGKVNLDPRLIGQVYLNFLTNAIKYTPKGGEVTVFISKKDDQIVSQIADNGYGIPKEEQGKVFQKFFRADNVAKIETDGTGLGLYLVKAIIESSGGKVWFKSEEGKGTTFWFSLPASGMKAKEGEVTLDV